MSFMSRTSSSSWRDSAGRQDGREGYQFGDVSRSVWKSFTTMDWRAVSGRSRGDSSYHFGDISRAIAGTAVNAGGTVVYAGGKAIRSLSACSSCSEKSDMEINEIWEAFFKQCATLGMQAVDERRLLIDDVESQEPYLFLGLPGCCLLECVLRSLSADVPSDAVKFADGRKVTSNTIPEQDGAKQLFMALMVVKRQIAAASLDIDRLARLRHLVLHAEGDTNGDKELAQLGSMIQSIATDISQLPFYRSYFLKVLEEIVSKYGYGQ